MSMSKDQRDERLIWVHPDRDDLKLVSARTKHDRRFRALVAQDGDQILREWWPSSSSRVQEAISFLNGYGMAKAVFGP